MTARFLVAKYVPDLRRMEPANVGVIVWANGHTDALFAGEDPDTRELVGSSRRIVNDRAVYKQWIESWRQQLSKPSLEIGRGESVRRDSPGFLDALKEWSRGNFILVDGGEMLEQVDPKKIHEATAYLFQELVSDASGNEAPEREREKLKTTTARLLKSTGILGRPDCHEGAQEWYKALGVLRYAKFDVVWGPVEKPYSLYQRVLLRHQKTFDSIIGQLHWFRESRSYPKERLCAFVVEAQSCTQEQQKANRELLNRIATVIDVGDEPRARQQLQEAASLNGKA